jgi:hypothetical protein
MCCCCYYYYVLLLCIIIIMPNLPLAAAATFYMFTFVLMCVRFETEIFAIHNCTLGIIKQIKNKYILRIFVKTP